MWLNITAIRIDYLSQDRTDMSALEVECPTAA